MKTVAELRAEIEAAKAVAMERFERDWSTCDVQSVADAFRLPPKPRTLVQGQNK